MAKEDIVHIKITWNDKMNIIQHIGYKFGVFYRKYSDVTHFVIIIIFITDDNLITHKFSVTDRLHNFVSCD